MRFAVSPEDINRSFLFLKANIESHGVVVSTGDSPYNDPGSIPGSGGAVGIWVCYPCGSATSFGWDVKPRSGLRAHAFKIMRGPKRTWMTKRKSRGPETYRWCRHAQTPWKRNVAAYGRANWKLPCTYSLLGTRRMLQASKQKKKINKNKKIRTLS